MTQLPLIEGCDPEPAPVQPQFVPPREELYCVLAVRVGHSYWRLFPEVWATRELAERAASDLSPFSWHSARIVRIPGEDAP